MMAGVLGIEVIEPFLAWLSYCFFEDAVKGLSLRTLMLVRLAETVALVGPVAFFMEDSLTLESSVAP